MKIFGYQIISASTLQRLYDQRDTLLGQSYNHEAVTKGLQTQVTDRNIEMAKQATTIEGLQAQLETSSGREARLQEDLDKARTQMAAFEANDIAAQNGRLLVNEFLTRANGAYSMLKSAWDFRKENAKMGPAQRLTNNKDIETAIATLGASLPLAVTDPSNKKAKLTVAAPAPEAQLSDDF